MDYIDETAISLFAFLGLVGWMSNVFGTRKMIKKVGINRKYYPKGYIMPGRKIRKLFKLKKQEIPRWTYCSILYSFGYIAYFLVFSAMYLFAEDKYMIMEVAEHSFCFMAIFDLFIFVFYQHKYRK